MSKPNIPKESIPKDGKVCVNIKGCANKKEVFQTFEKVLGFPTWWGKNWDAFWDCLRNLRSGGLGTEPWFELEEIRVVGHERLKEESFKDWKSLFKIAQDSVELDVLLILHDMEEPDDDYVAVWCPADHQVIFRE